jgi:hypothetical protein
MTTRAGTFYASTGETRRCAAGRESECGDACFSDKFIEEAAQISRLDHCADRRGKDHAGVDPVRSEREGFGSVIWPVGSEHLCGRCRKRKWGLGVHRERPQPNRRIRTASRW